MTTDNGYLLNLGILAVRLSDYGGIDYLTLDVTDVGLGVLRYYAPRLERTYKLTVIPGKPMVYS